ncbi:MAG: 30S ribosome-binding factor RbfA [Candidatus Eisenbacteria bacterium]
MSSQRIQRVAVLLWQEISEIVRSKMKDPRLGFITVTHVEVSPDLHYAKVYVSSPGAHEALLEQIDVLSGAAGFVRGELFKRVTLRFVPELSFKEDTSIEHGMRISKILKELERQEKSGEPEERENQKNGGNLEH